MIPSIRPLSYWADLDGRHDFVAAARRAQHHGCMYGLELWGDLIFVFLPRTTWAEMNEVEGVQKLSLHPRAF